MTYPGDKKSPPDVLPHPSPNQKLPIKEESRLDWAKKKGFNMQDERTVKILQNSNRKKRREILKASKQYKRGTYKPKGKPR